MKIIRKTNVSDRTDMRIMYTVEVAENKFVDVMNCVDQNNLFYVMESSDGRCVYDADGNPLDIDIDEKAIIGFVKNKENV